MENLEFGLKKIHARKNHGISKKDIFMGKSWNNVLVIHFFFNIRIYFSEFIFCHLYLFLSLIFDYWWLHTCAQIFWRKNNLGEHQQFRQITHAAKTELSNLENKLVSWKNHGILFQF